MKYYAVEISYATRDVIVKSHRFLAKAMQHAETIDTELAAKNLEDVYEVELIGATQTAVIVFDSSGNPIKRIACQ